MDVVQQVFDQMKAIFDIVMDFVKNLFEDIKGLFGGNDEENA